MWLPGGIDKAPLPEFASSWLVAGVYFLSFCYTVWQHCFCLWVYPCGWQLKIRWTKLNKNIFNIEGIDKENMWGRVWKGFSYPVIFLGAKREFRPFGACVSQEETKKLEIQFVRCLCVFCVYCMCVFSLFSYINGFSLVVLFLLTCSQVPQVKFYILQKKQLIAINNLLYLQIIIKFVFQSEFYILL